MTVDKSFVSKIERGLVEHRDDPTINQVCLYVFFVCVILESSIHMEVSKNPYQRVII